MAGTPLCLSGENGLRTPRGKGHLPKSSVYAPLRSDMSSSRLLKAVVDLACVITLSLGPITIKPSRLRILFASLRVFLTD